jgi:hypothetical protein
MIVLRSQYGICNTYTVTCFSELYPGFGWVNRCIGYFQVATTINFTTLKTNVTITHKIKYSTSACLVVAWQQFITGLSDSVTTDSQLASLSLNKATIWVLRTDF